LFQVYSISKKLRKQHFLQAYSISKNPRKQHFISSLQQIKNPKKTALYYKFTANIQNQESSHF